MLNKLLSVKSIFILTIECNLFC